MESGPAASLELPSQCEDILEIPRREQCLCTREIECDHTLFEVLRGHSNGLQICFLITSATHRTEDETGMKFRCRLRAGTAVLLLLEATKSRHGRIDQRRVREPVLTVELRRETNLRIPQSLRTLRCQEIIHDHLYVFGTLHELKREVELLQIFIEIPTVLRHREQRIELRIGLRRHPRLLHQLMDGFIRKRTIQMDM